jgi:hypothetical protein
MGDDKKKRDFWGDDETRTDFVRPEGAAGPKSTQTPDSAKIDRKISEARALMEQTHQLYLQYFNGIEKRMPLEKAKQLEGLIQDLNRMGAGLTVARFKINQFISQYQMMKDLWERKLRDREKT